MASSAQKMINNSEMVSINMSQEIRTYVYPAIISIIPVYQYGIYWKMAN